MQTKTPIAPEQEIKNDVFFIMSALNDFWHEANAKLLKPAMLGDLELKNYRLQKERAAELMHGQNKIEFYVKAAYACRQVSPENPEAVADNLNEMVGMLKEFRSLVQQMIHLLPTGKNRNEVCDFSIKLCGVLDKIEK